MFMFAEEHTLFPVLDLCYDGLCYLKLELGLKCVVAMIILSVSEASNVSSDTLYLW